MIAEIDEVGRILARYGCTRELSVIQALRQLHDSDAAEFARRIRGEMNRDLRSFRTAIVEVADELEAGGLGTERIRDVAGALRLWIERDVPQGGRYVRPATPPDLEAEIALVATADGGRPGPVCSGYFPSHILDPEIGMCGAQHEYPDDCWLFPGHRARALLRFLSPEVHRGRLFAGMQFTVHEGHLITGHGSILRVLNGELERAV